MNSLRATLLAGFAAAACLAPASPGAKRVLVVTETTGYRHASIPVAVETLQRLGDSTGLWTIVARAETPEEVARWISADGLRRVDLVAFVSTTGDLSVTPAGRTAFYNWLAAGGAFVGIHSATDTWHDDTTYLDMIGAEFVTHGPQVRVMLHVQDPAHPATAGLPDSFPVFDEIYEFRRWDRARAHVLLSLHAHPQTGAPGDYPLAWTRRYGTGRVFYVALGHREDVYALPWYRSFLAGGMRWALGLAPGDDTPGNPVR